VAICLAILIKALIRLALTLYYIFC